tara:strand:+ start:2655 stop:2780 length:126 start_codon:yes stop_codon:yes gene_type:complete
LTKSAPALDATSISFLAFSIEPLWLTPTSAMTFMFELFIFL